MSNAYSSCQIIDIIKPNFRSTKIELNDQFNHGILEMNYYITGTRRIRFNDIIIIYPSI